MTLVQRITVSIAFIPDKRLQRYLSRTMDSADAEKIMLATVDPNQRRRMKDLGKPSPGLFLYPQPAYLRVLAETGQSATASLNNSQLHQALNVRMGTAALTTNSGDCVACGKSVNNVNEHLMFCMHGRIACHNTMLCTLATLFRDLGFSTQTERMLFPAEQKRMDLVVNVGGSVFAVDLTIVSPLASTTTKPAVIAAAEAKVAKYKTLCESIGARFVPAAFDMWGNRCPQFEEFIKFLMASSTIHHPHITQSATAVHTRITVGLFRAVGGFIADKVAAAAAAARVVAH